MDKYATPNQIDRGELSAIARYVSAKKKPAGACGLSSDQHVEDERWRGIDSTLRIIGTVGASFQKC
jgi:hypothetical protein